MERSQNPHKQAEGGKPECTKGGHAVTRYSAQKNFCLNCPPA